MHATAPTDHFLELGAYLERVRLAAAKSPLTRPFAFLVRVARDIHRDALAQREAQRRAAYQELMLLEIDLSARQLGDQERIAQRVGTLKGLLACCALALLLAQAFSPDDQAARRAPRLARNARAHRVEEVAA